MRDVKALATIVLCLDDGQLIHVAGKTTAKVAWDWLKDVYAQLTAGVPIMFTRKMHHTVMMPGDSVRAHLNAQAECF